MAKAVFLYFLSEGIRAEDILICPLTDDPTIEYKSSFASFGEMMPSIDDLRQTGVSWLTSFSGGMSSGIANLSNLFDIQRWQKTEPVSINLKLVFYTKTDPVKDVWDPVKQLVSYTILSKETDGSYTVPGISLATVGEFKSKNIARKSKLIGLHIPGVIYLDLAMILAAVPTYSKQTTASGYPLWAQVDFTAISIFPANTGMFDDTERMVTNYKLVTAGTGGGI